MELSTTKFFALSAAIGTLALAVLVAEVLSRRPQSAPTMHTFEPRTFRAQRGFGDARLEAFALNVLADVELRSGDTKASCAILNATLDLELRRKIGDRFGEAESLFTQAPLARAKGRDADVVGLLGDARRRRVEIGDRPGIAECNAELARLPQRPVPA